MSAPFPTPFAGRRRGFTLVETMVALGVLGVVLLLVAQVGILILSERQRDVARQDAEETAANILEASRACPWEDLTPAWAARQRLPDSLARRPYEGRLTVRVEPEPSRPHVKRVTVEIRWTLDDQGPERQVRLVGLRSARTARTTGGKP